MKNIVKSKFSKFITMLAALSALTMVITSCAAFNPIAQNPPAPVPPAAPAAQEVSGQLTEPYAQVTDYSLYYQVKNYALSMYEPENGCFLGAYVLSNKAINYDMSQFDGLAGKKHAVTMYNMTLGDACPDSWIVSCVAGSQTPFISVGPRNSYDLYDKEDIDKLAAALSKYRVPIFVEFFPDPEAEGFDPAAYLAIYAYARSVFRAKVPDAAFVWSVSLSDALDCERYYPGDGNVDWVGASVYERLIDGGYGEDFFPALDYFYYTFQKTKPIMISRFAVSRYSSADRAYRDEAASAEITRVYSAIVDRYPRIKLINYMDFNGILLSGDNTGDNFSISDSDKVMAAYSSAIGDSRFLSAVDTKTQGDIAAQWMKSPFPAYKSGNGVYISADSYRLDLNISGLRNPVEIGGVSCYSLDALKTDQSKSVSVDDKNMQIWVSGK